MHGAAEEEMTAAREKVRVKLFTVRAAEARLLLTEASGACRGGWRQTWSFRNTTAPMGLHTRLASASCFQKSIDLLLAGEDWAVSYIHTAGGLEPHLEVVAQAAPSARPSRRCRVHIPAHKIRWAGGAGGEYYAGDTYGFIIFNLSIIDG